MPGSMIHLLVAKKVNPNGSALFYLGNIAPDAVTSWHEKDISHFRNLEDRLPTLVSFAKETNDEFSEGILLHLYFDWKWDMAVMKNFIVDTGVDWFTSYRNELGLAGSHLFHHTDWAKQLWHDMDNVEISSFGITPHATAEEVKIHVSRNNKWHNDNVTKSSTAFPPELIERFTTQIANEYINWRLSV